MIESIGITWSLVIGCVIVVLGAKISAYDMWTRRNIIVFAVLITIGGPIVWIFSAFAALVFVVYKIAIRFLDSFSE